MKMIEKVAANMLAVGNKYSDDNGVDWRDMPLDILAKAAIEAMQKPTDEMLYAARDWSADKYGKPIGNDAAIGCFNVMINAALNE